MPWTRVEQAWRDDVLRALMPPSGGHALLPPDLGPFWERFLSSSPPSLRITVRLAVWTVAFLLPVLWAARPLSRLGAVQRDAVVTRLAASPSYLLRQVCGVLKLCACFAAFTHAPTRTLFPGAS